MEIYNYELKQKLSDSFLKTVSSFANYNDGRIVFGLDNEGLTIGLSDLDETKLKIENKINDSLKPRPEFRIDIDYENTNIIVTVYKGENTPYYYNNRAYKRSDSSDVEVDREELNDLILSGKNLNYENLPSKSQDLTFNYFNSEAIERMGIENPDQDLLKSFNLYSNKNGYNNAALTVADKNDYPIVDLAKFGESISEIEFRDRMYGISILEAFNKSIAYYKQYYNTEVIEGKDRNAVELIPYEAFRESLANAIVHRRWDKEVYISISFYDDRIEISSPGGLPNNISEDEYLNRRVSSPRNPIISNLFFRFRYIENLGSGIFRIKDAYRDSNTQPKFIISENYVTVILPTVKVYSIDEISSDGQKIINALGTGESLSRSELEKITGFNKDKVIRIVNDLRDIGVVEVEGNGRGTKYRAKI